MEIGKRVNPELQPIFSYLKEMNLDDVKLSRETVEGLNHRLSTPPNSDVKISNRFIPGLDGAPEVRIRIYDPKEKKELLPGLLYIHGGGYVLGNPEGEDPLCCRFAIEAQCVVISVDYSLAPEHPFPAGLEDCYAALKWLSENASDLGVDANRIAVAGTSAGGGLTAAVSLLARDRNGPTLIFQMPLYPMIDDQNITPSSREMTNKKVWCRDLNIKAWELYLGDAEVSKYAVPARETNFSGLPPTYTCVGELDPFRDETLAYVSRLSQAGVPTEFHLYPGCFHGFEILVPNAEISQRAANGYVQALKRAFWG